MIIRLVCLISVAILETTLCTCNCENEPRCLVHEGDGGGANDAEGEGKEEAHEQDHERVEAAELVLPQCEERNEGGADVDSDGGEEAPDEHLVPDLGSRSQWFRRSLKPQDGVEHPNHGTSAVPATPGLNGKIGNKIETFFFG